MRSAKEKLAIQCEQPKINWQFNASNQRKIGNSMRIAKEKLAIQCELPKKNWRFNAISERKIGNSMRSGKPNRQFKSISEITAAIQISAK
jgi:hypothetical protein